VFGEEDSSDGFFVVEKAHEAFAGAAGFRTALEELEAESPRAAPRSDPNHSGKFEVRFQGMPDKIFSL
jgi:hypothetical protein